MQQDTTPSPDSESQTPIESDSSTSTEVSKDARSMAMLSHLLGFFTSVLVPLIIWIIKKEEDAFIENQSKEALNFQISIIIGYFAVGILSIVTLGFASILFPLLMIGNLVFCIIAAMKSNEGVSYRYPLAIRLVK